MPLKQGMVSADSKISLERANKPKKKWFIPIIFPSVLEFTAVLSHRERSLFSVIEPTSQIAHCYKVRLLFKQPLR